MRLIYEPDIEGQDFLEIILTPFEAKKLEEFGIAKDFEEGLWGERPFNICIRIQQR